MNEAETLRSPTVNVMYPAVPEAVPLLRITVGEFAEAAGASGEQLEGICLTVSEAVSNVVQHAYGDGPPGAVYLTSAVVAAELWVLIADEGCGLSTRRESPGLGLGIAWMAQFSDGLTLVPRACGGLEVRLRFDLLGGCQQTAERAEAVAAAAG